MLEFSVSEKKIIENAQNRFFERLAENGIFVDQRDDFDRYAAIRHQHGDQNLNQAFDPQHVKFNRDDFWLLAQNGRGEAIATYCLRRLMVGDFFELIRSLALWSCTSRHPPDPRFVVACEIPPFGGEVVHCGGLWIRNDYRGFARLAVVMPHLARALALRQRPFDHDSAMIRDNPGDRAEMAERKAVFMGQKVYGFARVHRFVDGWFPPEGRNATVHLCHLTRAEAVASLARAKPVGQRLRCAGEFGNPPLVDQNYELVHTTTVLSQRQ